MSKKLITIRVSPYQLDKYGEAAERSKKSRHSWCISAIMVACGLRRERLWRVPDHIRPINIGRTEQLHIKLPAAIGDAAEEASRLALLPISSWVVLVLDHAAGMGELHNQMQLLSAARKNRNF